MSLYRSMSLYIENRGTDDCAFGYVYAENRDARLGFSKDRQDRSTLFHTRGWGELTLAEIRQAAKMLAEKYPSQYGDLPRQMGATV